MLTQKARSSKAAILDAAVTLASQPGGLSKLRRDAVAKAAGVASGLVTHYWGSMNALRNAVVRKAVADENLAVVGEAVAIGHKDAIDAPRALRTRAAQHVATHA